VYIDDFKKTQKFTQVISLEKVPEEKTFEFNLNNVLFDFDSDRLTKVSLVEMEVLRDLLNGYLVDSLFITGHCDSVGTEAYNDALGLRRAKSVMKYLAELEMGGHVETSSSGKREPVVSNSTEFGRSLNRRVQFKIRLKNKDNEKIEIVESHGVFNDVTD
jgi:outer membrane protein OmpA-like peptidoglycan-associated protein